MEVDNTHHADMSSAEAPTAWWQRLEYARQQSLGPDREIPAHVAEALEVLFGGGT